MDALKLYQLPDGSWLPELRGGDGPDVPPPDPGLVRRQNEMLDFQMDQAKRFQQLEPLMLAESGLKYNPETKAYEYLNPGQQANKQEIERLQTERSLKALKGELPVSETLKKELELGENKMKENLYRQLGPGWELSTPGQQAMREYQTMATSLKEGEQRDMLTTAEALALNRQSSRSTTQSQMENPFAAQARAYSPYQNTLNNAMQGDQFTRSMQFDSEKEKGRERAGYISGGASLGMSGLAAGMMFSDPAMKEDVEPISDGEMLAAVRGIPVKKWRYKGEAESHIGGMADTMPEIVSDGRKVDVISYLGMLTSAVRALDKKFVDKEESVEIAPGMALAL
ncbi:MAG: hypothetical protein OEY86_00825 [Nitrospira sp.]|nr:hypothetical protein [Nitrospira sp.]